jgi:hypothetical protein
MQRRISRGEHEIDALPSCDAANGKQKVQAVKVAMERKCNSSASGERI